MPVRLALLSLAALLAPAAHCAAECPARDAGATATSLEEALASGAGWEGRAQSIFECIVPHTFTKGKYSFDDESRLGSRRGTETKEQCRLLRDTVQEVVQRWIKRDPAERENYVGQYVSLKSTFFVWVLPSLTGGRNDDAKSRFTSIFKACEEAHSKFGLHGDTREHIDMDRAPWLERGYQEWRRSQNSKSCEPWLALSVPQLVARIDGLASAAGAGPARGNQIVEGLGCLVPNAPNDAEEGGRVPLEGAACDKFSDVLADIGQRAIEEKITRYFGTEAMFSHVLRKKGVEILGGTLVSLGEMKDACEEKRPRREWGTTNREQASTMAVTLRINSDIPRDDSNSDSFRVQMFCVPGLAGRQGNFHLSPGHRSSLRIGLDRYKQLEGFSCQLNRGLSSVRRYTIENHKTICVSSNLWVRRLSPRLPYHVIVEDDSCPYQWRLVPAESTDNHAVLALTMKSQADRDGGKLEDVEAPGCAAEREATPEQTVARMRAALARGGTAFHEFVKCLVPLKTLGNLKARRSVARCDLLAHALGVIGSEAYREGRSSKNGLTVGSVNGPFSAVDNVYDIKDGFKAKNNWDACREPIPEDLWGENTHHTTGPLWEVRVSAATDAREIAPDDTAKAPTFCLHGVVVENQGVLREKMALRSAKERGLANPNALHVGLRKWQPHEGFSCGLPLIQRGGCLLGASLMKYADEPWFIHLSKFDKDDDCPVHWVLEQNAEKHSVRVRLERK